MPELRKDPIIGRWVILAAERAKRPVDFPIDAAPPKGGPCAFCEGQEAKTPPEIVAVRAPGTQRNERGWKVRVVPNKYPALMIEGDVERKGQGLYDMMNGVGAHEVIVESPEHVLSLTALSDDQVRDVLWIYRQRLVDLKRDTRLLYGLIFKNVGERAGASLEHSHSQLIVTPIVPLRVTSEIRGAEQFYEYRGRCVFCDIIRQEVEQGQRIVFNDPNFISFEPFAPRFPFETWIMPKRHASHFESTPDELLGDLARILRLTLAKIEGALKGPPYNYLIHTSPFDEAEQREYHWHIEIIPRITRVAGFEWGTGFYINPVPPENAAQFLREVKV